MISRGQFGAVAIERILSLLSRYSVRSSFAVPGHTAYAFPRLVKQIHSEGHEIVHHGWVHENPADFDLAGERQILDRGIEALQKVVGERPKGYRSPAWDLSEHSIELLLEYGFEYDSSCMGQDFYPYYLRSGDKWSTDTAYHFGATVDLVEVPVMWSLDDFPVTEFVLGFNEGLKAPSSVEEMWRGDFDYGFANCPGGIFTLTLHPQTIGRGNRMLMLERLLKYFSDKGAVFTTMGAYVADWRKSNPKEQWMLENEDLTGKHAIN